MAAGFLAEMGFDGTQTVVDPMCGSGTFVLEAAEIAAGLVPGRSRAFAFERMVGGVRPEVAGGSHVPTARFFGYDRDDGAIRGAQANAERAGVSEWVTFERQAISDLMPPEGVAPGLVMVTRRWRAARGAEAAVWVVWRDGAVLAERFKGWRVGIVTSDGGLARRPGWRWSHWASGIYSGGRKCTSEGIRHEYVGRCIRVCLRWGGPCG